MIDKICEYLISKIKIAVPDIDEERAEVINYGLQNLIGEVPKIFVLLLIAYVLGIFELTLLAFLIMLPYRMVSGGFHLKTHLGCIITTSLMYCGTALLSKYIIINPIFIKYILLITVWIFGMVMIRLYAPADTENVPILRKKERIRKRRLSYLIFTITLVIAIFIKDNTISNLIIFGMLIQTLTITRFAYKITKNVYGYEVYQE